MPLQATSGAASYDAFGGGVAVEPVYIEEIFSTFLYTGNGSTQTITNGIDLSTKGGLVWTKNRTDAVGHRLKDTTLGTTYFLESNSTSAQIYGNYSWQFNSNGYQFSTGNSSFNYLSSNYASWTFRKQPKFFDVVTFTSDGSGGGTFSHNLGSVPGCVIMKSTGVASSWITYHQSTGTSKYLELQSSAAEQNATNWISVDSTTVTVASGWLGANRSIVAYLFAHDAGGFGLTGTDNVISCGSFTGPNETVTLGYEPQWILYKSATTAGTSWQIIDNMRGMSLTDSARLFPNSSGAEVTGSQWITPTATGFITGASFASQTFIYIAIRRGPMKVPTDATKVFSPVAYTGSGAASQAITTGFVPDVVWWKKRSSATNWRSATLLAGVNRAVSQNLTAAEEVNPPYYISSYQNTGFTYGDSDASYNTSGQTYIADGFSRAPSFMDVVCFTGNATTANRTYNHNLGTQPELIIIKARAGSYGTGNWFVATNQGAASGGSIDTTKNHTGFELNSTAAVNFGTSQSWSNVCSATTFTTNGPASYITDSSGNTIQWADSGTTYVAYLFATCAGVSKVGSYTGNGTTQTINCGFTGGARFVLIKRTDLTGDWYVYDTARGMTVLTDPYLLLNSTAAESATLGSVTTVSTGFAVNASILAAINTNAASYIFLAIA